MAQADIDRVSGQEVKNPKNRSRARPHRPNVV